MSDDKRLQIIHSGVVLYDLMVSSVDFRPVLRDGEPPCEMQVTIRYGQRRPDGTIEVNKLT